MRKIHIEPITTSILVNQIKLLIQIIKILLYHKIAKKIMRKIQISNLSLNQTT